MQVDFPIFFVLLKRNHQYQFIMKKLTHTTLLSLALVFFSCQSPKQEATYQIVPLPQEVVLNPSDPFVIGSDTRIVYPQGNDLLKRNAEFLSGYLQESTGKVLQAEAVSGNLPAHSIVLTIDPTIEQEEGYKLQVNNEQVTISGKTPNGVFYGIQTLRKSIPAVAKGADIVLPAVEINDYPRFVYRGMHLDVCRHFFPVEFVKEYIDLLALHNMNTFHWHLTDDQGWRIEIKKYPKLTEIGSQRNRTVIGHNTNEYEEKNYGGFYTQEQIKEVIAYAQERYITIIPEVDLPGHMLAALAAYPELGCTGGPYEVCPDWGVFEDVLCIGNDQTLQFIEDVLAEVVELFPSKLIHIGGDESPRDRWKVCPKCQARIKAEGLKADAKHSAEDRLQTYCTRLAEQFLNSKGRRLIGWDEILEGDVAPDATIMSWRGMEGGIQAAQLGHDVVMTPTSHLYFDYYQTTDTKDEPLGIGGYVPLEKVYSLEPVPAVLTEEERTHILGAQANLWTEYILDGKHVEYMVLPRMAALCEVQWTEPEKKNYQDFTTRLPRLMEIYSRDQRNFAQHAYELKATFIPDTVKRAIVVELSTIDDAPAYYTLDGSTPTASSTRYQEPIVLTQSADLQAIAIRSTGSTKVVTEKIGFNKATLCPIELKTQPNPKYTFQGAITLVDGLKGNDSYATGRWLGFPGYDAEATIRLGKPTEISKVSTHAVVDMGAWIMGASGVSVSVSDDGNTFREVATKEFPSDTDISKKAVENYEVEFAPVQAALVRVTVKHSPALPKGHSGEGKAPYLFVDEIEID